MIVVGKSLRDIPRRNHRIGIGAKKLHVHPVAPGDDMRGLLGMLVARLRMSVDLLDPIEDVVDAGTRQIDPERPRFGQIEDLGTLASPGIGDLPLVLGEDQALLCCRRPFVPTMQGDRLRECMSGEGDKKEYV